MTLNELIELLSELSEEGFGDYLVMSGSKLVKDAYDAYSEDIGDEVVKLRTEKP